MPDSMQDLIASWDGEAVVIRYDRESGTWIFVAMHSSKLGMPIGGCRMKVYPAPADGLRDVLRLSRGMTSKLAAIQFHFGGGKSVLAIPHAMEGPEREALLRRFGRLLEHLGGAYATGIDLGTSPEDMAVIAEETRWVFQGDPEGGRSDPGPYTARGVLACMQVVGERLFGGLAGRSVLVQGIGGVGEPLARLLSTRKVRLLLSDLDLDRAKRLAAEVGAEVISPGEVMTTECDILAPCAVGGTLNPKTIPSLRCRAVVGSANNQLENDADADRLAARGIVYAPDYIVNAGGAIAYALMHQGTMDEAVINARIHQIGDSLAAILDEARKRNESPLHAATRRVEEVLAQAS
ncbi:MAG: Glu/Leu/Phe/Val dehydrogenase dimerization domain-containing protein [Gemmatimonadales bacterium]